jgi:hypothetical protein
LSAFLPARYLFSVLAALLCLLWRKPIQALYLAQALYSAQTLYLARPPKPKSLWPPNPIRTFNPARPLKLVPKP